MKQKESTKERDKKWVSLLLCLMGLYLFVFFDDFVFDKNFIKGGASSKGHIINAIIHTIAQNKYGYYIVRAFPLIVSISFARVFYNAIRKR